jgi:hypothetical protein
LKSPLYASLNLNSNSDQVANNIYSKHKTTRMKMDELKISMNKLDKLIQMEKKDLNSDMLSDEEMTNDLSTNNREKGDYKYWMLLMDR